MSDDDNENTAVKSDRPSLERTKVLDPVAGVENEIAFT